MLTIKLKILLKYKNLIWNIPLPELAVVVSKPSAMSFDLTCSQASSLIVQNSIETQILNMENTTASTGSRCEQALGHQL
jgi:hypothetical protein